MARGGLRPVHRRHRAAEEHRPPARGLCRACRRVARAAPARDRLPRAAQRAGASRRAAAAARRDGPGSVPGLRARRGPRAPLPGRGALRLSGPLRGLRSSDRRGNGVWRAGDRSAQLVADRARPGRGGAVRSTRDRVDPRSPRAGAHRRGLREHLRSRKLDERHTWRGVAERTAGVTRSWSRWPPPESAPGQDRGDLATAAAALRHRPLHVRMLEQLREHCDIDAFVETDPPKSRRRRGVGRARPKFEVKERVRAGYDSVVFCLGNSEFHAEALDLLRRRRSGVVLAHDVRLSGLYAWTAAFRPELLPHGFLDSLRSMYAPRAAGRGLTGWLDWHEADRYGIYMAREAIGLADRYLVHSDYAAQVAMLDSAPATSGRSSGSSSVPRPSEVPGAAGRASAGDRQPWGRRRGKADGEGRRGVRPSRRAASERHARGRRASASEAEAQRCHEAARRFGVEERVRITGPVDDDEFRRWLEQATLAVQLREHSNGETQATIADCLAAGIPTVVTALGSARELPDDVVAKVEREISAQDLAEEYPACWPTPDDAGDGRSRPASCGGALVLFAGAVLLRAARPRRGVHAEGGLGSGRPCRPSHDGRPGASKPPERLSAANLLWRRHERAIDALARA